MTAPTTCLCMEVTSCVRYTQGLAGGTEVFFHVARRAHPINSLTLTQSCVTPRETNLSQVFFNQAKKGEKKEIGVGDGRRNSGFIHQ